MHQFAAWGVSNGSKAPVVLSRGSVPLCPEELTLPMLSLISG